MIDCVQTLINKRKDEVMAWVNEERAKVKLPIYSSFDIRDNGYKATIVDSNLFPAGFNNLTDESRKLAAEYFKEHLPTRCPSKDVLIIPEAHTRNLYYLSNLNTLKEILTTAGYNVTLGSIREDIDDTLEVEDSEGRTLVLEKMRNQNGKLLTKSFTCGAVLLNNDFSVKTPDLLVDVKDRIMPPVELGWHHRRKANHFKHFCKLVSEFGKKMDVDCWTLCPSTEEINDIDFKTGQNVDKVADLVDKMIAQTQEKYDEYKIPEQPYMFVKDNSGTYGMGILSVHSGKEILELNSKNRRKMATGKEQAAINSVVVQEGVTTKYKVNGSTAEPVLYAVGGKVVGGFMRLHDEKDEKVSLNAPGAKFDVLLRGNITKPIIDFIGDNQQLSLYTLLANMANIAIGKEREELE